MSILIVHVMAPQKRMRNKQIDWSLLVPRTSHSCHPRNRVVPGYPRSLQSMHPCVLSMGSPSGAPRLTFHVTTCLQGPVIPRFLSREKSWLFLDRLRRILRGAGAPRSRAAREVRSPACYVLWPSTQVGNGFGGADTVQNGTVGAPLRRRI